MRFKKFFVRLDTRSVNDWQSQARNNGGLSDVNVPIEQPETRPVTQEYKAYRGINIREIPRISRLSKELLFDIDVVSKVFPFKVNNFVNATLIDWSVVPDDPIFALTYP